MKMEEKFIKQLVMGCYILWVRMLSLNTLKYRVIN